MAATRGLKTRFVRVRLTPRQFAKLEQLAIIRDATISAALRELVDGVSVDVSLPYSNDASGQVLPDPASIARNVSCP